MTATSDFVVLVTGRHDDEVQAMIRKAAGQLPVEFSDSPAQLDDRLDAAVAVAGTLTAGQLRRATHLRWVHSWAAGPNADLNEEMLRRDEVALTSSVGNGAIPLAEHALLLMMMLNRDAARWSRAQAAHRWDRFTHGELAGLTLGLFGVGHAGRDLARKAAAFHMRVVGCRANPSRPEDHVEEMFGTDRLQQFLGQCDMVVVTAPITEDTRGIFDEAAFSAMRRTAFWICISRGGIADDVALEKALREGWIAGAGLDAHGVEPLPPDSPFWDLPNVVVTPHNGATTAATARRGVEIFVDNLRRFAAGRDLSNIVDKVAGY